MLKINIAEHSYLKISNTEAIYQKYTISNNRMVGCAGFVSELEDKGHGNVHFFVLCYVEHVAMLDYGTLNMWRC